MKRTVQVYVADVDGVLQRLDLFKDETISLKDTIQDVRDIAKVFTEFTQSFTVPASKTNNKLFKHFYNADISNGYDARLLHNARIEINNIPFKSGFVTLEGVDMKDNKPQSYKVTFYGETVSLKDVIGDDKLSDLDVLNSLNKFWIPQNDGVNDGVKESLTANPASNDVIVPLITHSQRLYYYTGQHVANTGNVHFNTGGGTHQHGLRWDNLKYALRVNKFIEGIESKYTTSNGYPQNITFSNDFFKNASNESFYNLFMWLHRKKGEVSSGSQVDEFTTQLSNLSEGSRDLAATELLDDKSVRIIAPFNIDTFELEFNTLSSTEYSVVIESEGVEVYSESGMQGNELINQTDFTLGIGIHTVFITSTANISFSSIAWSFRGGGNVDTYQSASFVLNNKFEFIISQQVPDMKIIDFLTGLFKMFNLTSFVKDNGEIYIDTLDSFYGQVSATEYNIDEFVDSSRSQVNSGLPYREINLKYEDTGTLLAKQHEQLKNSVWAQEEYNAIKASSNNNFSGDMYDVVVPFGHLKYEHMIDISNNTNTNIQWGYSADDNFNEDSVNGNYDSYIGKPVLFYPVYYPLDDDISFVTDIDEDGDFNTHISITGSINMPSNSISFSSSTSKKNINFNNEINEFSRDTTFTDTLFKQYYESYITQVFTKSNRIIKLKAYLPLRILLNYTLADKFIYKGRKHQINSITTNLTTGESEIELLNIVIE
tara:strand:- start:326 stop:2464 length:2139 start_codon:yes stop_codon:yes gene_type:complete